MKGASDGRVRLQGIKAGRCCDLDSVRLLVPSCHRSRRPMTLITHAAISTVLEVNDPGSSV